MTGTRSTLLEGKKTKRDWQRFIVSTTSRVILSFGVLALAVVYVVQTSLMSTKGYDISALKKEIRLLEEETRRTSVEVAEYRSLRHVEERLSTLPLVPTNSVTYLTSVDTAVAKR